MPIINNLVKYAADVIILAGEKAVEIGMIVQQAAVEIVQKILLMS